ncbi:Hydroxyacylglutathione hydrolase-like protein [Heterocephalus glaber]|uniref:Hydroxyacylglutathione hydrolase-like protein n=1 Tax=Heterocephalus glaber TaxID=10181 RepID=G5BXV2_HETGA|nr:Hydroxyacylglutathione hydrolase-like protein [Heterocephalus glaber]
MKVKVIPVLEDNYMYLVIQEHKRETVAVNVALAKRLLEIAGWDGVFGAIYFQCPLTPGHTFGHMSYFLWEDECLDPPALFSDGEPALALPVAPDLCFLWNDPNALHCPALDQGSEYLPGLYFLG